MRQISGKELCKIVERHGWQFERSKGSHRTYSKRPNPNILSIPVHGNRPLKPGTLRDLLNKAGIDPNTL